MHAIILEKDQASSDLELHKLIPLVEKYFKPNGLFFYFDLTASVVTGNMFIYLAAHSLVLSPSQILYIFISSLALFRATVFIHEISHSAKSIPFFKLYYNLIHGFLHKVPSYIYNSHRYHHMPRTYGTAQDAEYDNFIDKPFYSLVIFPLIVMALSPLFLALRWSICLLLFPFIGEKGRLWFYKYASTLALRFPYVRPDPTETEKREWYIQDFWCFIYSTATAFLLYAGYLPMQILFVWYLVVYFICVMNFFRTLLNHRYMTELEATTHKQQIIDSITLPLSILNNVFYPLGLSYHALHHMFPQVPYHNMKTAHNELMMLLAIDHPYRLTLIKNFPHGIEQFIRKKF